LIKSIVKFSPKAILFDWDNTLVNNWDPIIISYNETLKSLGLKKQSKEETLKNAKYSLRETFPNLFKDDWKKAREIFYETFKKIHLQQIKPLPKVEKILKIINEKKILCGVISNKDSNLLRKEIKKLGERIHYESVFPPNALDGMEKSIRDFDGVQKKEQGAIRIKDILLFPAGTIVASGPTCAEDGPGRWLPKPSDTFRIFGDLLKPSVGFKMIPMIWYEMMGVNRIVGFILPDWIADILPGKYPVHNSYGKVEPNFKSKVLDVVTGEFEAFKIPIPTGHIWDSFLRVFLGLSLGIIFGVPLGIFMGLNWFAKGFFDPLVELYRPVPPLAWAPLVITVFGIDNVGKVFLLFMVALSIMIISARAGASGTQLSKIHAAHS